MSRKTQIIICSSSNLAKSARISKPLIFVSLLELLLPLISAQLAQLSDAPRWCADSFKCRLFGIRFFASWVGFAVKVALTDYYSGCERDEPASIGYNVWFIRSIESIVKSSFSKVAWLWTCGQWPSGYHRVSDGKSFPQTCRIHTRRNQDITVRFTHV